MPTIVHFEIPVDDLKRAKKFYSKLFEWEMKDYPKMDYTSVMTNGKKAVHGGMMKRQHPKQQIMNYIDVKGLSDYVKKVVKLGGKVMMDKMAIPGVGYFAVCMDTESNVFGLFENDKKAK